MKFGWIIAIGAGVCLLASSRAYAQTSSDAQPSASPEPTLATSSRAPASNAATAEGAPSREAYLTRQRDLQRRIDELRADLQGSHAHLEVMYESLLGEPIGGGRLVIRYANEMGPMFGLDRAVFTLDGVALPTRDGQPALYNGAISPGEHTITVDLEYGGRSMGLFPYLTGYHFRVHSVQSFTLRPGRGIELRVVGYEQGPASPIDQRPAVRVLSRDVPLREVE